MRKLGLNLKHGMFIQCFLNQQANLTSHTIPVFTVNPHKYARNAPDVHLAHYLVLENISKKTQVGRAPKPTTCCSPRPHGSVMLGMLEDATLPCPQKYPLRDLWPVSLSNSFFNLLICVKPSLLSVSFGTLQVLCCGI